MPKLKLAWHTVLKQMIEVLGETATHLKVRHPKTGQIVDSPKDLYDLTVRDYRDLDERALVKQEKYDRMFSFSSATVPFKMRGTTKKWIVFLTPEILGREVKSKLVTPARVNGPLDVILVDAEDRRLMLEGLHLRTNPEPKQANSMWSIMRDYGQVIYQKMARLPRIENLPHRIIEQTPLVQVVVEKGKPIPAVVKSVSKARWTVELLVDAKIAFLRRGMRLVTRREFLTPWPERRANAPNQVKIDNPSTVAGVAHVAISERSDNGA